jgi:mono/diheme cytochrome c family protein
MARKSLSRLLNGCACACLLAILAGAAFARQNGAKKSAAKSSAAAEGAALYKRYCAVCHGNDAKGGSAPKSGLFTEAPPDLTTLAKRHNGDFPGEFIATVLRSGVKMPEHGPAEMPVWGTIFKAAAKSDEAQVNQRIAALTAYLESLQVR